MSAQDPIFETLREGLIELFEVAPERVVPEARLNEDLEIDSIDAIDLIDHVRRKTGLKISPENFKSVRTLQDVVDAMRQLENKG